MSRMTGDDGWLLGMLLAVTVITLGAYILALVAGQRRAALRHAIWSWALFGVLCCPAWSLVAAKLPAGWLQTESVPSDSVSSPSPSDVEQFGAATVDGDAATPANAATVGLPATIRSFADPAPPAALVPAIPTQGLAISALILWCAGSAFGLLRLMLGVLGLRRLRRPADAVSDDAVLQLISSVASEMGMARAPDAYCAPNAAAPFAVGIFSPAVYLHPAFTQLAAWQQRAVILHELAHLRHHHSWFRIGQQVAAAIYWPHPLIHFLNRQLSLAQEDLCDNAVLRQTDPRRYSRTLLAFARSGAGLPASPALGLITRRAIECRIERLVDPRRNPDTACSPRVHVVLTAALIAAFACAVLPLQLWAEPLPRTFADTAIDSGTAAAAELVDELPASVESYISFYDLGRLRETHQLNHGRAADFSAWVLQEVERYSGLDRAAWTDQLGVPIDLLVAHAASQLVFAVDGAPGNRPFVVIGGTSRQLIQRLQQYASSTRGVAVSVREQSIWLESGGRDSAAVDSTDEPILKNDKAHSSIARSLTGGPRADLSWFVATSAALQRYAAKRRSDPERNGRGANLPALLRELEMFAEDDAVGGVVEYLRSGPLLMRHRSVIYSGALDAALADRSPAAGGLRFENSLNQQLPGWLTDELQSVSLVSFDLAGALPTIGKLVDGFVGDRVFDEVLRSILTDPNGPKVDVIELVRLLEGPFVAAELVEPNSVLIAIGSQDEQKLRAIVDRMLEHDPLSRPATDHGITFWDLDSRSAVAVYRGYLLICSNSAGLRRIVEQAERPTAGRIEKNELYARLRLHLGRAAEGESMRFFARDGGSLLPPFRLVPVYHDGETVYGQFVNQLANSVGWQAFSPPDDRSSLPGPSALRVTTQRDGWDVRGFVLRGQ